MNPMDLFKVKGLWDQFTRNHPKFPMFMQAVANNTIREGTVLEMTVTTPEGENYTTNLKITASDMELLRQAKEIGSQLR